MVGGRIAFDDTRVTHVFTPVSGEVSRILASPGQQVHKGSPLAAIRSPDVASAISDELKARADLKAAERDFDRQQKLLADKAASRRDYEAAEDAYRRARTEEDRARQGRSPRRRSGGFGNPRVHPPQPHRRTGDRPDDQPRYPGAGPVRGGAAQELFTIGDTESVWLFADVPEDELGGVRQGAPVQVRVLAWPDRAFSGRVDWVSPALNPSLRTTRIRCTLPNHDGKLKPEMFATVSIERPSVNALAIPRKAVSRIEEKSFVYVAAGSRPDGRLVFRRRMVDLPERAGPPQLSPDSELLVPLNAEGAGEVAVLGGLKEGERVLVEAPISAEASAISWCRRDQQPKLTVVPVESREVVQTVTVGGRLSFDDTKVVHVFSPVNGRVTRLVAAPGAAVKKGSPLAVILSPDLGSALSDEIKAQADLTATGNEVARQRDMFSLKASSARDVEAAEDAYDSARAELNRAKLKTRLLYQGTDQAVSQEYVLRSPLDGQVVARMANPGVEVPGNTRAEPPRSCSPWDPSVRSGSWDVYEVDLPYVSIGTEVAFTAAAYPGRTFHGRVDSISDVLNPVMRTAKIRCVLENGSGGLRPEMDGVARISVPPPRAHRPARCSASRRRSHRGVRRRGRRAKRGNALPAARRRGRRPRGGEFVSIESGLTAKDRVVSKGAIFLLGSF